jgi:hypothetical protein
MQVWIEGSLVHSAITFNLQEHGIGGVFKALVGGDKEKLTLSFPRSELLSGRLTPRPAGVIPHLRPLYDRLGVPPPG